MSSFTFFTSFKIVTFTIHKGLTPMLYNIYFTIFVKKIIPISYVKIYTFNIRFVFHFLVKYDCFFYLYIVKRQNAMCEIL